MILWIIIIAATVLFDQVSKLLVVNFLNRENPLVLIKGVLRLSYVENPGMAFGWLGEKPYERWIFMIVSTLGILALLIYLIFFRPKSKVACAALSLIIGGGIGNMIDRLFRIGTIPNETEGRYVVIDFIDFCAFPDVWKYVFNIADSCVCIGAGILICWCVVTLFFDMRAEKRKLAEEKALANAAQSSAPDKEASADADELPSSGNAPKDEAEKTEVQTDIKEDNEDKESLD